MYFLKQLEHFKSKMTEIVYVTKVLEDIFLF